MSISDTAMAFFDACETGKGWGECAQYCAPEASFSCQSQALAETHTLEAYTEWMKGLLVPLPDGHYELKGFSTDDDRDVVLAFAAPIVLAGSGESLLVTSDDNADAVLRTTCSTEQLRRALRRALAALATREV